MLITYLISGVLLVGFSYLVFKKIVRHDYLTKGKLSFISYSLETLIFALHANFMYLFIPVKWPNLPRFPDNPVLNILVSLLIYGGLAFVLLAMTNLGFGATMGQDKNILKTGGLYKYSRNPQVIGYIAILIGFVMCYPSIYAVGWVLMFFILIGFMINTEEEFLRNKYTEAFENYCRTVPRFMGFNLFRLKN